MPAMEKSVHTPEYARLLQQLRAARRSAGLSQRELAARLSVPHTWVFKVESGERRLDVLEFSRLILACGSDPVVAFEHWLRDVPARNLFLKPTPKDTRSASRIRSRPR